MFDFNSLCNISLYRFCSSSTPCCPEEGADPESIEKVALQVLAIKLPVNQTALDTMIKQIKESFVNMTNIEGIINQTSQHIGKAKELLDRAKDAKYVAAGGGRLFLIFNIFYYCEYYTF